MRGLAVAAKHTSCVFHIIGKRQRLEDLIDAKGLGIARGSSIVTSSRSMWICRRLRSQALSQDSSIQRGLSRTIVAEYDDDFAGKKRKIGMIVIRLAMPPKATEISRISDGVACRDWWR